MAITIRHGYVPGALGRIAELHARYYHQHWGFGLFFEAKVAADLAEFLRAYQPARDRLWTAIDGERIVGSIALDRRHDPGPAHLRWFILDAGAQGRGLGGQLMAELLAFSDQHAVPQIFLNTFAGLDAARHLYERAGFALTHEQLDTTWGVPVREQRFERLLPPHTSR